jgi:hypothetical protein
MAGHTYCFACRWNIDSEVDRIGKSLEVNLQRAESPHFLALALHT